MIFRATYFIGDLVSGGALGNKSGVHTLEWFVVPQHALYISIPRPPRTGLPETPLDHPDQSQEYLY